MTARIRSSKQQKSPHTKSTSQFHPNSGTNAKENTMTTTTKHHTTSSTQSVTPSTNVAPAPADIIFVKPPPAEANIPSPPAGFNPPVGTRYTSVKPKKLELASMADAVVELTKFTDFQAALGRAAPPYEHVLQMFDAASQWSTMRDKSAAWDVYCAVMEGAVWTSVREQMNRMKPVYAVAIQADPSLGQKYPQLTRLLEAKQAIAKKAVTTRRANKLLVQEGKMPTHGAAGKKRKRAADKAVLAQVAQQQPHVAATGSAATAKQDVAPASQPATAPQPTTAAAPAPAATPVSNGANGANGTNGAAQHT